MPDLAVRHLPRLADQFDSTRRGLSPPTISPCSAHKEKDTRFLKKMSIQDEATLTQKQKTSICESISVLLPLKGGKVDRPRYEMFKIWKIEQMPVLEWYVDSMGSLLYETEEQKQEALKELFSRTLKVINSKHITKAEVHQVITRAVNNRHIGNILYDELKQLVETCSKGELSYGNIKIYKHTPRILNDWYRNYRQDSYELSLNRLSLTTEDIQLLQLESNLALLDKLKKDIDSINDLNGFEHATLFKPLMTCWDNHKELFLKYWALDESASSQNFWPLQNKINFLRLLLIKQKTDPILESIFWPHIFFPGDLHLRSTLLRNIEQYLISNYNLTILSERIKHYKIDGKNIFYWFLKESPNIIESIRCILLNHKTIPFEVFLDYSFGYPNFVMYYLTENYNTENEKYDEFKNRLESLIISYGKFKTTNLSIYIQQALEYLITSKKFTPNEIYEELTAIAPPNKSEKFHLILKNCIESFKGFDHTHLKKRKAVKLYHDRSTGFFKSEIPQRHAKNRRVSSLDGDTETLYNPDDTDEEFEPKKYLEPNMNTVNAICRNIEVLLMQRNEELTSRWIDFEIENVNPLQYYFNHQSDKKIVQIIRLIINNGTQRTFYKLIQAEVKNDSALFWYFSVKDTLNRPKEICLERISNYFKNSGIIVTEDNDIDKVINILEAIFFSSLSDYDHEFFDTLKKAIHESKIFISKHKKQKVDEFFKNIKVCKEKSESCWKELEQITYQWTKKF